jgi:thiosulfate/3-mercaptopyruvate sulfurtransferase
MHWLGAHGITPDSSVVVYDDLQGAFAARLWWLLRWLGHEKVAVLDGGWQAWQDADGLMESIEPEYTPTTYQATPNDAMWLSTSAVSALLTKCDAVLVDVRAAERFRGEIEPLDPVAGHIPSAVNIPLTENTTSEGVFKSPEALRKLYETSVKDKNTRICMCGSGITACQSILAMEVAGIEGALLYAGSWSEWIRDPQRPVATV